MCAFNIVDRSVGSSHISFRYFRNRVQIYLLNIVYNTLLNCNLFSWLSSEIMLVQIQSGRNIRHLPCVVRRSGVEGVCMFAIDCIKANGTHLGTCIDRFYFGSCCQLKVSLSKCRTPQIEYFFFLDFQAGYDNDELTIKLAFLLSCCTEFLFENDIPYC